jgi:hypothetical protein
MRRGLPVLLLLSVLASCGPASHPGDPTGAPATTAAVAQRPTEPPAPPALPVLPVLPSPQSLAEPAPGPGGEPVPDAPPAFALEPVETLLPEIRLGAEGAALDPAVIDAVIAADGVSFATAIALGRVPVTLADGRTGDLTVAAVDPAGFRVLVPQITADEPAVWQRLVEGGLAVTHDSAAELGISLDDEVAGAGGTLRTAAIGAFGQPAPASAVVALAHAAALGLDAPTHLLVAVEGDAWPDEVADALTRATGLEATLVYGKPQRRVPDLPTGTVWDRLAQCEASGDWRANTGNGYYGGLQFLPSSWHLVGGVGLPHEASRDEQILRGEILLRRQGWRAWPVCSVRLGLRQPGPDEHPDGRPRRAPADPRPAPADPAPGDTGPGDTGPADTGPGDTGPGDAAATRPSEPGSGGGPEGSDGTQPTPPDGR